MRKREPGMSAVGGTEAGTGGSGVEAAVRIGWASVEGSEEREERKTADVLMESDLEALEEDMRAAIGCGGGFRAWRRRQRRAWCGGLAVASGER